MDVTQLTDEELDQRIATLSPQAATPDLKALSDQELDSYIATKRDQAIEPHYQKAIAEEQAAQATPPWSMERARNSGIVNSYFMRKYSGTGFVQDIAAGRAQTRLDRGEADDEDMMTIARHRLRQHLDQQIEAGQSPAQRAGTQVGELPATLAQLLAGGKIAKALTPIAEGAGAGRAMAATAAEANLNPAFVPLIAVQRNVAEGRDPFDISSLPAAEAIGVIQLATMKLGGAVANKVAPGAGPLAQLAVAASAGTVGQQAAEYAGYLAGLETHYGALQHALKGDWLEAGTKFFRDMVTMGVFHGAHGKPEAAKAFAEEAVKSIDVEAKKGAPVQEAVTQAAEVADIAMRLEGLGFVDPNRPLTFQEAQKLRRAGKWAPGSPKSDHDLLQAMTEAIPDRIAPQKRRQQASQPIAQQATQEAPVQPAGQPGGPAGIPPVGTQLPNGDVIVQGPNGPIPRSVAQKLGWEVGQAPAAPENENPRAKADRMTAEFQAEQKRLNLQGYSAAQINTKLKEKAKELSQARDEAFVWEAKQTPAPPPPEPKPIDRRANVKLGDGEQPGAGMMRHPILDAEGKDIGGITVSPKGDVLEVNVVATSENLGPAAIKGVMRSLADAYPEAKFAEFRRTTGPNAGKFQRIPIGQNARNAPTEKSLIDEIAAKHGLDKQTREVNEALDAEAKKGNAVSFDDIFDAHNLNKEERQAFLGWHPEVPGGGRSLRDMAAEFGASHETIRARLNSAFDKMGLRPEFRDALEAQVKGENQADLVANGQINERQLTDEGKAAVKARATAESKRLKAWEKYIARKGKLTDEERASIGEAINRGESPPKGGGKAAQRKAGESAPVQDSSGASVPVGAPNAPIAEQGAREAPAARPGSEAPNADRGEAAGDQLKGAQTKIALPTGGSVPAHYEVRELNDVRASHQVLPSGALRDRTAAGEYPQSLQPRNYNEVGEREKVDRIARDMVPTMLVTNHPAASEGPPTITPDGTVLNGNGRQMALERARWQKGFDKYKDELIRQAGQFGLDPAQIRQLRNPVLYRVVDMEPESAAAKAFAAAGNVAMTQGQSPVRAAASLGRLVTPELLDAMRLEGDSTFSEAVTQPSGKAFRERLKGELPPQEVARYFTEDNNLTDAGKELVRNMLLAKIIPAQLIERMGEEMKRPKQSLEGVIPQLLLTIRDFPEANIAPQLNEALKVWSRNYKIRSVSDADNMLAQRGLFGGMAEELSPGGRMMLDFLLNDSFEPKTFRKKLMSFASELAGGAGLFGDEFPDVVKMAAEHLGVEPRPGAAFGDIQAAIKGVDNAAREALQAGHSPAEIAEVSRSESAAGMDDGDAARAADFGLGATAAGVPFRPPGAGAPGVGVGTTPTITRGGNTTGTWYHQLRDGLKAFAQQAFPATTRIDKPAAEKLAQVANAPNAAKAGWDYYSRILKIEGKPLRDLTDAEAQLAGAVWIERRFRWAREELARMGHDTSDIPTLVGQHGSPLTSEKVFQDNLDGMYGFFEAVKQEWTREVEKNYRGIMGLEPIDAIDSPTQEPGLPLNLIALSEDNPAQGVVKVGRKESLANLRLRKPGFTRETKFSADAYDIDLRHMMQRTLELGTAAGRRAEWARAALDGGSLVNVGAGGETPEGWRALPISSAGLPGLDPRGRYFAHPETYQDAVQGLGISDRPGQVLMAKALKVVNDKLTGIALMTPVELMTHTGNHFTALLQEGMGTPILNLKNSFENAWKIWQGEPEIMRRVYELAKIGAAFGHEARPGVLGESLKKYDPTAYVQKFTSAFIDTMQKAVRVQLDTAYSSLVRQGLKPNSETARRDFINQALGNYQAGAGSRLVQFLKDTGLQPFATAAATFTTQGAKKALLLPNAPDVDMASTARNRTVAALKLMPFLAMGPVVNSLYWGQAFPKNVPAFGIKTRDDDEGKTHYFDPLAFTGLRRGWRAIGLNAMIEEAINGGKSSGEIFDRMVKDWMMTGEHFVAGPMVQAVHTAATGENMMGHRVAPKVSTATTAKGHAAAAKKGLPEKGSSQKVQDFGAAIGNLNPLYASMTGADRPKGPRSFWERFAQSLGPFGEKTRENPPAKKK